MKTIKEIAALFGSDLKEFTKKEKVLYGIIAPLVLVVGCVIAEMITR